MPVLKAFSGLLGLLKLMLVDKLLRCKQCLVMLVFVISFLWCPSHFSMDTAQFLLKKEIADCCMVFTSQQVPLL